MEYAKRRIVLFEVKGTSDMFCYTVIKENLHRGLPFSSL